MVVGVLAAFEALAIGQYDPTSWLVVMSTNVGFPLIALIGLILMAVANISSISTIIYPAAITLVSLHYGRRPNGYFDRCIVLCSDEGMDCEKVSGPHSGRKIRVGKAWTEE